MKLLNRLEIGSHTAPKSFEIGKVQKPKFTQIHRAFEFYAKSYPNNIAVEHDQENLTYEELNRLSDELAMGLIEKGVKPGDKVGLFLERSISMVVGILGILKCGAAYVPQDARIVPVAQLNHVVHVAKIKVVLSHSNFKLGFSRAETICLNQFVKAARSRVKLAPLHHDLSLIRGDVCFLLFTSGTTGKPNGVLVTHDNLANILLTSPGDLGMTPGMKVAQLLNISFDMAAWEILGALTHGCTLLIRGDSFQEVAEKADILIATPSVLARIDESRCRQVHTVAVAGEPCPKKLADKWSQFTQFFNSCGPTEVTIVNTMKHYSGPQDRLNIGTPTPNNRVYILNEQGERCKIGEVGELWAAGNCVTKGYLENKSLTEDRYRFDPFCPGERMFRTRDLGSWNTHGEIEFHGRTDDQVKVKGFRVELRSISHLLEQLPGVSRAITIKINDKDLVSIVCSDNNFDKNKALSFLKNELPYYAVPERIFNLKSFPITSRGKLNSDDLLKDLEVSYA